MKSPSRQNSLPVAVLAVNTLGFAICFAAWVIFGPSSRNLARNLHLSPTHVALLKAAPILVGSVLRIPMGILTDRIGARVVFPFLMLLGAIACFCIPSADSWPQLLAGALVLGTVGATFAVGVQSVSAWSPAGKQGVALGILGSGNAGTALTTLFLPILLGSFGLASAFHIYAAVLAVAALLYWILMRDAVSGAAPRKISVLLMPLRMLRTWRFALYYMATFGAFVGATLVLSDIYIDAYHVSLKTAGFLATTFTLTASLARIPGGKLADAFSARRVLSISLATIILALTPIVFSPSLLVTGACILVAGLAMGVGMAASMRYIPDYFPTSVGAVGGIVGALGGVGGFALTLGASAIKSATGSSFLQVVPLLGLAGFALTIQLVTVMRIRSRTLRQASETATDQLAQWGATLHSLETALETKRDRDVLQSKQ